MHASPFQFDPYASPPAPQQQQRRAGGMEYFESFSFYFNNPNWLLNLLLVTVCQLIPIAGPIALMGYEYELILAKHRSTTRTYPDFDFARFPDYLTRGIWPFLVQFIVSLAFAPIGIIGMFIGIAVVGTASGQAPDPTIFIAMFPVMALLVVVVSLASALVITPMSLRAGLMCEFAGAFDMAFIKDFIRLVGWETVLAMGFLMIGGIGVVLIGMLACFIGIYPATSLILLAYSHLKWQLYELYLDRGGIPIPLPEVEVFDAVRV